MKSRIWMAAAMTLGLAACGGDGDAPEEMEFDGESVEEARAAWPEGLAERIDSGNVAYREGRYDESAEIFGRATEQNPHIGSTWFGLYMAEHARGNIEAADSALAQAEALTPGLRRMHGEAIGDSAGGMPSSMPGGMPPGHPGGMPPGQPDTTASSDADATGGVPLPSGH